MTMVILLFTLCSLHGGACHDIDPGLDQMPETLCRSSGQMMEATWWGEHPFLAHDYTPSGYRCVEFNPARGGAT